MVRLEPYPAGPALTYSSSDDSESDLSSLVYTPSSSRTSSRRNSMLRTENTSLVSRRRDHAVARHDTPYRPFDGDEYEDGLDPASGVVAKDEDIYYRNGTVRKHTCAMAACDGLKCKERLMDEYERERRDGRRQDSFDEGGRYGREEPLVQPLKSILRPSRNGTRGDERYNGYLAPCRIVSPPVYSSRTARPMSSIKIVTATPHNRSTIKLQYSSGRGYDEEPEMGFWSGARGNEGYRMEPRITDVSDEYDAKYARDERIRETERDGRGPSVLVREKSSKSTKRVRSRSRTRNWNKLHFGRERGVMENYEKSERRSGRDGRGRYDEEYN